MEIADASHSLIEAFGSATESAEQVEMPDRHDNGRHALLLTSNE